MIMFPKVNNLFSILFMPFLKAIVAEICDGIFILDGDVINLIPSFLQNPEIFLDKSMILYYQF